MNFEIGKTYTIWDRKMSRYISFTVISVGDMVEVELIPGGVKEYIHLDRFNDRDRYMELTELSE